MYGVIRKDNPTANAVHQNRPLTNMSIAYMQDHANFIADKVFPVVPVDKKSDSYYVYTQGDWFRDEAKKRAPSTETVGSGYTLGTDTYSCDVWGFHKDIDEQMRANADDVLTPDQTATEFVTQRLLISRERQWVTTYFTSGVWGTDSTPTNLWDDYANSDPAGDIETAKETIETNTGFTPNTLVLGPAVWKKLKHHPDFKECFKYVRATPQITLQMLAEIFEVERVLVGKANYNTAAEGATAVYSRIFGKHALLCYVNPTPAKEKPSAGYIFGWKGYTRNPFGISMDKFWMRQIKSDRVEGELAYDMKKVAANLGYFFASVVS